MVDRRRVVGGSVGLMAAAGGTAASAAPGPASKDEAPLSPGVEIVDPHHHMTYAPAKDGRPASAFLLPDIVAAIAQSGHKVTATVAVQNYAMYRQDGPPELRSLGEVDFLNGIAAMSASGAFGPVRVAAGIVSHASLRLGEAIEPVLEAHQRVAGSRLKGIRDSNAWDAYPVMGFPVDIARKTLLEAPEARAALKVLGRKGLTYDVWCFHHQIMDVVAAARATPDLTVVLNHLASPLAVGPYQDRQAEVLGQWKSGIAAAAKTPNIVVKIGGLGMQFVSPSVFGRTPSADSAELAALWKPLVETTIEAFGADRCMFESNAPPDLGTASYGVLWNTFKRLAAQASASEQASLFSGVARRVYRLT